MIEPSCSEWVSPSVLVRKRDGSVRWCIDLRKLNDITVKYWYPLPLLQDRIDALEGCRYFTTLDMIVHRPGKGHVNADGLSRIPHPLVQCNYCSYGCDVQYLPCCGCKYCVRANEQWDRFHDEVDDIVPLAVRHISQDESDTEPHEDATWVEKYTTQ